VAYTIGAIVRGDLWGRFFDFRPRGCWKTSERGRARETDADRKTERERERERGGGWEGEGEGGRGSRESRQPLRRGDTAKLSERQRVKGRLPIYLRRLPRIRRGVLFHAQATLSSSRGAANAAESERLFLIS